jgi:hypothetical protein
METSICWCPGKVELPACEAPYQKHDDGWEARSVWAGVQVESGPCGCCHMPAAPARASRLGQNITEVLVIFAFPRRVPGEAASHQRARTNQ